MKTRVIVIAAFVSVGLFACQDAKPPAEKRAEEEREVEDRFVKIMESEGEQPDEAAEGGEEMAPESAPAEPKTASAAKNKAVVKELRTGSGDLGAARSGGAMIGNAGVGKMGSAKGIGGMGIRGTGRGGGGSFGHAPQMREPRARNTESYKNHGVNEMTDTAEDHLSTFAVDVDTGSYTIARKKLESGTRPPAASVRVEEFVNYFRYDYAEPTSGPFAVHLEAAPSPFHPDPKRKLMRVGVQGKRAKGGERKPVHLTFLVDVSGSMQRTDKIGLAKKSLQVLTNNLREGDTVALATYAGRTVKLLDPTGIEQRGRILDAINGLTAGGSTAMNSGLELAYELALKNFEKDHVNRVLVLSDGDANVGPSSHSEILKRIRHFVDEGVTLSTIGFGMGNYKDTMMEQLANKGNGNYYYIDSMDEARKVFGEQVDGTLQVIAKDVKIQVDFNEDAVAAYRLVGYENRDIADKDFRNDKVDAGEIGAGHTVTALYEIILKDSDAERLATVRVRHKRPDAAKASEQAFRLSRTELKDDLRQASNDFQFAAAVAGFAELLRESKYASQISYKLVEEIAEGASRSDQADRQEFIALVRKAR